MHRFVVVIDPSEADIQSGVGARIEQALCTGGWRRTLAMGRARVFEVGRSPPATSLHNDDIIIGEIFPRRSRAVAPAPGANGPDLIARARTWRDMVWGRFVAIMQGADGKAAVYRDPSGTLDPFVWGVGRSLLIASDLPDVLPDEAKPRLTMDWTAVGRFLAQPSSIHDKSGLAGVAGCAPGGLLLWDGRAITTTQIWRPSDFTSAGRLPFNAHAAALRECVDEVLQTFSDRTAPAIVECSGGFDSAVTATGLVAASQPITALLNYAIEDPSGDERLFAQAVAAHTGLSLDISFKMAPDLSPGAIGQTADGFRPSLAALDEAYETALLHTAQRASAKRVFTGHGGDSVFFQLTTPLVLRDRVLQDGALSLSLGEAGRLARWSRRSAFSVLALALGLRKAAGPAQPPAWISACEPADHPWLQGLALVGPAKQLQIQSLLQSLDRTGRSRLDGRIDVIHPLMAQPILETALGIPADMFVAGGRGRALARASFQDRLPPLILARRSKGELGAFYARALSRALPRIVPYLADGLLAERGLLRPDLMREALDETALAQGGGIGVVLRAVAIEAWVRHWSAYAKPRA